MAAASLFAMALAWAARARPSAGLKHADPRGGEEAGFRRELAAVFEPGAEAAAKGLVDQYDGFGRGRPRLRSAHHQKVDAQPTNGLGVEAARHGVGEAGAVEVDLQSGGLGGGNQGR